MFFAHRIGVDVRRFELGPLAGVEQSAHDHVDVRVFLRERFGRHPGHRHRRLGPNHVEKVTVIYIPGWGGGHDQSRYEEICHPGTN